MVGAKVAPKEKKEETVDEIIDNFIKIESKKDVISYFIGKEEKIKSNKEKFIDKLYNRLEKYMLSDEKKREIVKKNKKQIIQTLNKDKYYTKLKDYFPTEDDAFDFYVDNVKNIDALYNKIKPKIDTKEKLEIIKEFLTNEAQKDERIKSELSDYVKINFEKARYSVFGAMLYLRAKENPKSEPCKESLIKKDEFTF
ncbi:MAG: hypothetical protein QXY63_01090 [Candidatus Bilamarchaeaceae archaeon]